MYKNKTWTMNSILAGVEVARLLKLGKRKEAYEYLHNLSSELTDTDIDYLITRAYAVITKEG